MYMPIDAEKLLSGQAVESDRLEYKQGLDPQKVAQTICAFSNDVNNIGGGYIIIGVESEDGAPKLPPVGLEPTQLEAFQKKIIEIQHKIHPFVQVIVSPENYQGKEILVIRVPGGDNRPYKAPVSYTGKEKAYYIRRHSTTVIANSHEERHLLSLASNIPYDDRINYSAHVDDINKDAVISFLKDSGSRLYKDVKIISSEELLRALNIVRGPSEDLRPVNIGLIMFADNPEAWFPGARIEIAEFEDENGKKFSEKKFTGPLYRQIKDVLSYIKNMVIKENVRKIKGKAEAERFFNYPYEAIEEVLVNAVYHRSYELRDPVEVNIFPDRIEFVSKPGPMPPIDNNDLKKTRIPVREYRNRRIGDFLKEIHLTEGRGTGMPEIRSSLKINGSPAAVFKTDKTRHYFLAILRIHDSFIKYQKLTGQAPNKHRTSTEQAPNKQAILKYCFEPKSLAQIMKYLKLKHRPHVKYVYITPLIESGLLEMTEPEKPNSPKQKYRTRKNK